MTATLILVEEDGTKRTLQLTDISMSTQINLSQPLPHEPGVPVVEVIVLHLHAEVVSDSTGDAA